MSDSVHGLFARYPNGSDHFPWMSRDYEDIDCQAIGCKFNFDKKCAVPTRCKINVQGSCEGFEVKPLPQKIDGD